MSRAFVKERDDEPAPRVHTAEQPRLVTPAALRRSHERLSAAPLEAREALQRRIASARVASTPSDVSAIAFGATVTVQQPTGKPRTFTITDSDDVDISCGRIGVDSPLAQALLGRRMGDIATWRRPAGDERLTILAFDYAEYRSVP